MRCGGKLLSLLLQTCISPLLLLLFSSYSAHLLVALLVSRSLTSDPILKTQLFKFSSAVLQQASIVFQVKLFFNAFCNFAPLCDVA